MAEKITPISNRERIDYLDVVRGIAILGILIANIEWFSLYAKGLQGRFHFQMLDPVVTFLQYMFIEGKFYSIFSLLFGWGIAIQLSKFANDDKNAARFIRRRLFFMLLLGGIHMLFIWEGDIVFFYALVGFVLIMLRRFSNKTLLITGVLLLLSPILLYYLKMKLPLLNAHVDFLKKAGEQIYQNRGWINQDLSRTSVLRESKSLITNVWITLGDSPYRFAYLFFTSRFSKILGAMILGFVLARSGIYPGIMKHKSKLLLWSIVVLIFSLPLNYLMAGYMQNSDAYYALTSEGLLFSTVYAFGVFPLAMVYMVFIALMFEKERFRKFLLRIVPAGKMAFSNYILQSLIGIILFYGTGFGLMEQFGPLYLTLLAFLIFTFQIVYSTIWLNYFRFGPVEWLWRSLTYKKIQTIRKPQMTSESKLTTLG